jgi:S1-C subfamily serine protease
MAWAVAGRAEVTNLPAHSVLEVLVTSQRTDPRIPWRRDRPSVRQGYGVLISPTRVVTTEELIHGAILVEVREPGRGTKWEARIAQSDVRANAAVLDVSSLPQDSPFKVVDFDGGIQCNDKVQIVTFDDAGQLKTGDGRVTEASVGAIPHASSSILVFKVLTDLKADGQGAPVFHDGRLAGLAMGYDSESQTSIVLPALVLQRIVEDLATPPYDGLASAGLLWTSLVDPAKRRYFKLADDRRGILVTRLLPGSGAASALKPGDVIVAWDGQSIDSQGYYNDAMYGRLLLTHLICGRRRPGDVVVVSIIRDGAPQDVRVPLAAHNDRQALVPLNASDEPADYLVDGGLILRELSLDYLRAFGGKWMVTANLRLVNLYLTRGLMPDKPGQRVVILTGVLPDQINIGYQNYHDEIVTRVNGQPIDTLEDVFAIVKRDGGIRRLTFDDTALELVLDSAGLTEANRRLQAQYRIPQLMFRRAPASARP